MSNPLIRPGDPRFQRPPLHDEAGKNRFADDAPPASHSDAVGDPAARPIGDVFATPQPSEEPAYRPQYVSDQPSRRRTMLALATLSLAADAASMVAILGERWTASTVLLFAGIVTGSVAWYLATDELSAIKAGVMPAEHRPAAWTGLALASLGVLLGLAFVATAVLYYYQTAEG